MANRSTSDIVARLTELVCVASSAINQQTENTRITSSEEQPRNINEDVLRRLYPSLGSIAPSASSRPQCTPASYLPSLPSLPLPSSARARNQSRNPFNRAEKGRKRKRVVEEKETMAYKDVFFINDPRMSKVPRRQDRQHYYDVGLVGSVVAFRSTMVEHEIRKAIADSIPRFKELTVKPEFEIMKAVGPRLFSVPEIPEWNYKILKHQTDTITTQSQSSVTVTTSTVSRAPHAENEQSEDIKEICGQSEQQKTGTVSGANSGINTSERQCPVCLVYFPVHIIQSHTNDCIDSGMQPEKELYSDLIFEDIRLSEFGSDGCSEVEEPQEELVTVRSTHEWVAPAEARKEIAVLVEKLAGNVAGNKRRLYVRRKTMWQDYVDYRKKRWVKNNSALTLVFVGEAAVDEGGPRREFFAGALQQMRSRLFTNTTMGMIPEENAIAIANEDFLLAGELCASTTCQGGLAPNFLSGWVYDFLVGGLQNVKFANNVDLMDAKYNDFVYKVTNASSEEDYQDFLMSDTGIDVLGFIGYTGVAHREKLTSRPKLLQSLFYKQIISPVYTSLHQFEEGLRLFGVLQAIKESPAVCRPLFTMHGHIFKWEPGEFLASLEVLHSPAGSNAFDKEVDTFKYFSDLVEQMSVESKCNNPGICAAPITNPQSFAGNDVDITIGDLAQFITGSATMPPLGLPYAIKVGFKHGCPVGCKCRPTASTCTLTLYIPCHASTWEAMKELFTSALKDCNGFGNV
eukprot:gene11469-12665_t